MKRECLAAVAALVVLASAAYGGEPLASSVDSLAPYTGPFRSDLAANRFVSDVDDASALYVNPAGLAMRSCASTLLMGTYWYDRLSELTTGAGGNGFGFGFSYADNGLFTSRSWSLGLAGKLAPGLGVGASFNWRHTDLPAEHRSPFAIDLGFTMRPSPYLSIGGVWKNVNTPRFADGVALDPISGSRSKLEDSFIGGVSIRPLSERVTISGQAETAHDRKPAWLVGGRIALARGLELFGSYERNTAWYGSEPYEEWSGGVSIALGSTKVVPSTRSRVNGSADYSRNSLSFEATDAFRRNSLAHAPKYAEVELRGEYLDEGGGFVMMGGGSKDLHGLLRNLESIRRDEDVKGLLLDVGPLGGAFIGPVSGNVHEIREAIQGVRKAGKPVVAYLSEGGSSTEMYVASAADKIVVPRTGTVGMIGVSFEMNRMKRMFEKLGVDFDAYTAGDYKSSFHTIYTDTTTAAQAEEIRSLVGESYRLLVEGIGEGRRIPLEHMKELADGRLFLPDDLLKERLVDAIGWKADAKKELGALAGVAKPDKLETARIKGRTYWSDRWTAPPIVAIVGAYGGIESGKSSRGLRSGSRTMGSETVVKQLKAAAKYPGVRAIVFRVDSGGGSALASDEILDEIRRIQREKKIPFIVSMGNVAGSGGYWISMYGDAIFADPFTVTGSIGVVWFKPVLERLYEKIGMTHETFKEGEHADGMSWSRHLTDDEMTMLDGYIGNMYGFFVDKVAEGRRLAPERVREIGGGRVYLGTQALELKLVDRLGGLTDAIEYAAEKAGIGADYRTAYFKAYPGFFETMSIDVSTTGVLGAVGRLWRGGSSRGFDEMLRVF